jgi:hypothetical protein
LSSKDQLINKQKLGLEDLTKELEKQKRAENETQDKLTALQAK